MRQTRLLALPHELDHRGGEGRSERIRLDRAEVGTLESRQALGWKVVVAARLHRGQPLIEAGEREGMVAHGADVVLRLPDTTTLDAGTRMKRVDDAPAEEVVRDRRRGNEETAGDRRFGRLRVDGRCLAEEKPESRTGRTKLRRRRQREVELQRLRQKEHAVDGRIALEVGEVHRVELVDECARPVVEHVRNRHVIGDGEREVQVGESVAAVHGERAHCGPGNDALILIPEP